MSSGRRAELRGIHVLVVDDDQLARHFLRSVLAFSGTIVNAAHAALCAACHGVRSHPVPVALVGECSIPDFICRLGPDERAALPDPVDQTISFKRDA